MKRRYASSEVVDEEELPLLVNVVVSLVGLFFVYALFLFQAPLFSLLLISLAAIGAWISAYGTSLLLHQLRGGLLYVEERPRPGLALAGDQSGVPAAPVVVQRLGFKAKYKAKTRPESPELPEPEMPSPAFLDLTPYAGRWVALLHGEVAGVGDTAADAHLAARLQWGEEDPTVVRVPRCPSPGQAQRRGEPQ